ncbi:MAG: cytochrome b/b6 domain-containing protein [Pseudomonadota bacterium]
MDIARETLVYERRRVYDPVLRLIHAWNALAIVLLLVTAWLGEEMERGAMRHRLWEFHIDLGYALIIGMVARLTWGLIGPAHARFSDMWYPRQWMQALRRRSWCFGQHYGHNVGATPAYLAVYGLLLMFSVTGLGLAAIEFQLGPAIPWLADNAWLKEYFEEPHEVGYYLMMVFVLVHVAALIYHERKDRVPLAQSMVSGFQYRIKGSKDAH